MFSRVFLNNFCLRTSCYHCQYTNLYRPGDFTIGDFWEYQESCDEDKNEDKGISMPMINSSQGEEVFNHINIPIKYFSRTLEGVYRGNTVLTKPVSMPNNYESFWQDYISMSFHKIAKKYFYSVETQKKKNNRKLARKNTIYRIVHLPNQLLLKVLGVKRYEKLKNSFKR